MNREEIVALAREAGIVEDDGCGYFLCSTDLQEFVNFAALVAAKAAQDEREACAKRCEEKSDYWLGLCNDTSDALQACAASLRARGR